MFPNERARAFYGCWCATYVITFLFVLPQTCRDNVYSKYFRQDPNDPQLLQRAMDLNSNRLTAAKRYMNAELLAFQSQQLSKNATKKMTNEEEYKDKPSIAIGVMTTKREVEKEHKATLGYLTQTLGSFRVLSKRDHLFGAKHLFACNVDPQSPLHREVKLWQDLFDVAVRFPTVPAPIDSWELYEKEKQDYQFCLSKAALYGADYVVLVEDDAVPLQHFFETTFMAIKRLERKSGVPSWTMLKLYYPERWAGFGMEIRHFVELFFIGLLGGVISWAAFTLVVNRNGRYNNVSQLAIAVSIGTLYAILVAYMIGRPYIIGYVGRSWNLYWVDPAKQCCTQATLYPSGVLDRVQSYLDKVECDIDFSIDLALDKFIARYRLEAYMVEPNIIKHVGMFSSLRSYSRRVAEFI